MSAVFKTVVGLRRSPGWVRPPRTPARSRTRFGRRSRRSVPGCRPPRWPLGGRLRIGGHWQSRYFRIATRPARSAGARTSRAMTSMRHQCSRITVPFFACARVSDLVEDCDGGGRASSAILMFACPGRSGGTIVHAVEATGCSASRRSRASGRLRGGWLRGGVGRRAGRAGDRSALLHPSVRPMR